SRHSQISSFRSRVTPGVSCTTAARVPVSRFTIVDLPTFGKPTIATVPMSSCSDIGPMVSDTASSGARHQVWRGLRGGEADRAGRQRADLTERAERAVVSDAVTGDRVPAVDEHVQEAAVSAYRLVERVTPGRERRRRAGWVEERE